jgi:hypothetical protein
MKDQPARMYCPKCDAITTDLSGSPVCSACRLYVEDCECVTESIINHPPHYTFGGIEVIDAIDAWQLGFALGNSVKYIARAKHKGSELEDLKKARWYLDHEISKLEGK